MAAPELLQPNNIASFPDAPRRTRLRLDSVDRVRRELIKLYRQGRDGERGTDDVAKLAGVLGIAPTGAILNYAIAVAGAALLIFILGKLGIFKRA